jgi:hypothetical protein
MLHVMLFSAAQIVNTEVIIIIIIIIYLFINGVLEKHPWGQLQ